MKNNSIDSMDVIGKLFPEQIKVYNLKVLKKGYSKESSCLLHKHFKKPLSQNNANKLIWEIAAYLIKLDKDTVYSFFSRKAKKENDEADWVLSTAKLNRSIQGLAEEVVIFSYDLNLLGDLKKKLYRVLAYDVFFKENFNKVSSLTNREREIILLLSAGMSSREIADKVFLSVHTVNTHRKNINNKLSIQSFAGLLKYAQVFNLSSTFKTST